jgi:hypothetical protein
MKALTIRQPWAHAIMHLGKDVENRVWRTHYRGPLLIHAAAHHERYPREMLSEYMSRPPSTESLSDLPVGCIIGVAEVVDCVKNSKSKWADRGAWHWLVRNVRSIRQVDCTGRLRLWTPSPIVIKKLPAWVRKLDHK